jgi:hypothetical protein
MNRYLVLSIILVSVVGYSQKTALNLDFFKIATIGLIIAGLLWHFLNRTKNSSRQEEIEKMSGSCGCSATVSDPSAKIGNPIIVYNSSPDPKGELRLYYASWCGYSRQFLPIWNQFVEQAKKMYPWLKMVEIRCEGGNETLCHDDKIEGFPTIKLHKDDKIHDLSNERYPRTVDGLNRFIKKYFES